MKNLERWTITHHLGDQAIERAFYVSGDSAADRGVFAQIFTHQDYLLNRYPLTPKLTEYAQRKSANGLKPWVLDAGANIGASAVYFATTFPDAHIVGIEPDAENAAIARQNVTDLDVSIVEAALGSEAKTVRLQRSGLTEWAYRVGEGGDVEVPMHSAAQMCEPAQFAPYFPFIAKIDIEGGEADLFAGNNDCFYTFPLTIIELHDWMLPGQGSSQNFLRAVVNGNFDFVYAGENVFCFNLNLLC